MTNHHVIRYSLMHCDVILNAVVALDVWVIALVATSLFVLLSILISTSSLHHHYLNYVTITHHYVIITSSLRNHIDRIQIFWLQRRFFRPTFTAALWARAKKPTPSNE